MTDLKKLSRSLIISKEEIVKEEKKKKFLVDVEERLRYEKKLADDNVAA